MQQYAQLSGKAKHTVAKPGDRIPVNGLEWRIVSAGGAIIKTPLGATPARITWSGSYVWVSGDQSNELIRLG